MPYTLTKKQYDAVKAGFEKLGQKDTKRDLNHALKIYVKDKSYDDGFFFEFEDLLEGVFSLCDRVIDQEQTINQLTEANLKLEARVSEISGWLYDKEYAKHLEARIEALEKKKK